MSPERRMIHGRMCDHHLWEGHFVFHQCYRRNVEYAQEYVKLPRQSHLGLT